MSMHLYPKQPEYIARLIGIDPGTQSLGLCCMWIDALSLQITNIEATTFIGDKLPQLTWMQENHSDRFARIYAHRQNLLNTFNHYQPVWIRSEAPFINMRRPQAFAALIEIVDAIRLAVAEYDRGIGLELIDPSTVKKSVGASGGADKNGVKASISRIDEISSKINISLLDEHSIDSVAVAYSKLLEVRQNTIKTWSK